MAPPRKSPAQRQRRSTTDLAIVSTPREVPTPGEWLAPVVEQWSALWGSGLAGGFELATDLPTLHRLFDLRDMRARYAKSVIKDPLIKGSQGQPVVNPLAKRIEAIDAEVRQLEDRFGLNPKARLALGVSTLEVEGKLRDLTQALDDDEADKGRFEVIDAEAR